jgi:hypothetical protein
MTHAIENAVLKMAQIVEELANQQKAMKADIAKMAIVKSGKPAVAKVNQTLAKREGVPAEIQSAVTRLATENAQRSGEMSYYTGKVVRAATSESSTGTHGLFAVETQFVTRDGTVKKGWAVRQYNPKTGKMYKSPACKTKSFNGRKLHLKAKYKN